jgi:hypothetical protein
VPYPCLRTQAAGTSTHTHYFGHLVKERITSVTLSQTILQVLLALSMWMMKISRTFYYTKYLKNIESASVNLSQSDTSFKVKSK